MRQRLAVMAGGGEARTGHYRRAFLAQERDLAWRKIIDAGGEEADKAPLAVEAAVRVESLDADIVHMGAAMHQAAGVGFGDDQRLRLIEIGADFTGEGGTLRALADHACFFV